MTPALQAGITKILKLPTLSLLCAAMAVVELVFLVLWLIPIGIIFQEDRKYFYRFEGKGINNGSAKLE
jgi:hypothetical protein